MRKLPWKITILTLALVGVTALAVGAGSQASANLAPAEQTAAQPIAITIPTSIATSTPTATPEPTATSAPSIPVNPSPESRAPDLPVVTPQAMRGMSVIKPSNPSALPGTATYSEQELRAVIMTAGYWPSEFRPLGTVTVAEISLILRPQVEARVGQLPPMPNDLFYLVKLSGGFSRPAPDPGGTGSASQPVTSSYLYLLFDARTGNLMMKFQPAGDRDK